MAEITRRRQGEMLQSIFKVLDASPEGLGPQEVTRRVELILTPTDFEQSRYETGRGTRRFDKILRFTSVNAVKAGWLVKAKGIWHLTDDGRIALATFQDPAELMRESVRLYREWRRARPEVDHDEVDHDEDAIEVGDVKDASAVTLEEAEETARQEIRDYLAKMQPYDVQELVAALLRGMGYHVPWIAPPGPDKGVDIVAYTDPLGASGPRIKVQVKRRADKIHAPEVRSFFAVLGAADVGIFLSLGGFTSDAHSEARHQETRRISLLDVDDLIDLWVKHYDAIQESSRHLLPLRPIHYLALS